MSMQNWAERIGFFVCLAASLTLYNLYASESWLLFHRIATSVFILETMGLLYVLYMWLKMKRDIERSQKEQIWLQEIDHSLGNRQVFIHVDEQN